MKDERVSLKFYKALCFLLLCTSLSFCSAWLIERVANSNFKKEAINRACAAYNQHTGVWGWIVERVHNEQ